MFYIIKVEGHATPHITKRFRVNSFIKLIILLNNTTLNQQLFTMQRFFNRLSYLRYLIALYILACFSACNHSSGEFQPIFDGQTFNGWNGDTTRIWRIEDKMIIGGSLEKTVPQNEFLCTNASYKNFILTFKIKLTGEEGFINSGVQIWSKRLTEPAHEMQGFQADWGEGYWASLYDESRRNETLAAPDSTLVEDWIHKNDWNDYKIHAENGHIQLHINGHQTVDGLRLLQGTKKV